MVLLIARSPRGRSASSARSTTSIYPTRPNLDHIITHLPISCPICCQFSSEYKENLASWQGIVSKDVHSDHPRSHRRLVTVPPLALLRRSGTTDSLHITGLGLPLTRLLLKKTNLNLICLTSKSSSSPLPEDLNNSRVEVIHDVDLKREETVQKAAGRVKDLTGGKGLRLVVCLAGQVSLFYAPSSQTHDPAVHKLIKMTLLRSPSSYTRRNPSLSSTRPKRSKTCISTLWDISSSTNTCYR